MEYVANFIVSAQNLTSRSNYSIERYAHWGIPEFDMSCITQHFDLTLMGVGSAQATVKLYMYVYSFDIQEYF